MTPLLVLRGLVKRYGGIVVSDGIDLDIAMGEIHAVIGPNGAGKTTLVGQIAGEVQSDAGRIELAGADITRWPVARRSREGIGRSYQISSVIPQLSVLENVLLAVQAARGHNFHFWRPVTSIPELVDEADRHLELLDLQGARNRAASTLAYGSRRQLELAMALATRPRLLLLDEPMAGLATGESQQLLAVIDRLRATHAILLVEHDMQAVFSLADRLSVLVQGRVVYSGVPREARKSAIVREAYLGDEEMV